MIDNEKIKNFKYKEKYKLLKCIYGDNEVLDEVYKFEPYLNNQIDCISIYNTGKKWNPITVITYDFIDNESKLISRLFKKTLRYGQSYTIYLNNKDEKYKKPNNEILKKLNILNGLIKCKGPYTLELLRIVENNE